MQAAFTLNNPALARIVPFAVYIAIMGAAPLLAHVVADHRWIYAFQAGAALLALIVCHPRYGELKPPLPALPELMTACIVGALVCVAWIHLDQSVISLPGSGGFDPRDATGSVQWGWAVTRIAGAALVVPIMEELFWRSFVMRWIAQPAFESIHPAVAGMRGLMLSSLVFGVEHSLWLAGILAGLAYGLLYMWRGKLWTPILAHAVTNLLLGLWVLATGNWQFW